MHHIYSGEDRRLADPEKEPVPDDAESTIDESVPSSTASVSSSILNYRTLHGRRYHSEIGNASYWYVH